MPYIAVYWHSPRRRRQRKLIAETRTHTHTHVRYERKQSKKATWSCVCDKFQFNAYLRMEKFPFPVLQSELWVPSTGSRHSSGIDCNWNWRRKTGAHLNCFGKLLRMLSVATAHLVCELTIPYTILHDHTYIHIQYIYSLHIGNVVRQK